MQKIEMIWREILFQLFTKNNNKFTQKELAEKFSLSTSTVFQALKPLRKMGAVQVGGRGFVVRDPEKIQYHWANKRNLQKEIFWQTKVDKPVLQIEKEMISQAVFGCYSAFRLRFDDAPADYDKVYIYLPEKKLKYLKKRFPLQKGRSNLFVLKADPFLNEYGQTTTLSQTFVDLWNLSDWFAKEFINSIKEEINEFLS